jgi:hypothetical protein
LLFCQLICHGRKRGCWKMWQSNKTRDEMYVFVMEMLIDLSCTQSLCTKST